MQWLADNWLVLLLFVGMLAMHLFGHGHGSHGGCGTTRGKPEDRAAGRRARTADTDDEGV